MVAVPFGFSAGKLPGRISEEYCRKHLLRLIFRLGVIISDFRGPTNSLPKVIAVIIIRLMIYHSCMNNASCFVDKFIN